MCCGWNRVFDWLWVLIFKMENVLKITWFGLNTHEWLVAKGTFALSPEIIFETHILEWCGQKHNWKWTDQVSELLNLLCLRACPHNVGVCISSSNPCTTITARFGSSVSCYACTRHSCCTCWCSWLQKGGQCAGQWSLCSIDARILAQRHARLSVSFTVHSLRLWTGRSQTLLLSSSVCVPS